MQMERPRLVTTRKRGNYFKNFPNLLAFRYEARTVIGMTKPALLKKTFLVLYVVVTVFAGAKTIEMLLPPGPAIIERSWVASLLDDDAVCVLDATPHEHHVGFAASNRGLLDASCGTLVGLDMTRTRRQIETTAVHEAAHVGLPEIISEKDFADLEAAMTAFATEATSVSEFVAEAATVVTFDFEDGYSSYTEENRDAFNTALHAWVSEHPDAVRTLQHKLDSPTDIRSLLYGSTEDLNIDVALLARWGLAA